MQKVTAGFLSTHKAPGSCLTELSLITYPSMVINWSDLTREKSTFSKQIKLQVFKWDERGRGVTSQKQFQQITFTMHVPKSSLNNSIYINSLECRIFIYCIKIKVFHVQVLLSVNLATADCSRDVVKHLPKLRR